MEEREVVEQFRKRFKQPDLVISRVPQNTLNWFKDFASEEEFCKDYGLALKTLADGYRRLQMYEGNIPNPNELIKCIEQLQTEVNEMKLKAETPVEKIRRTLSGRIIGVKTEENKNEQVKNDGQK